MCNKASELHNELLRTCFDGYKNFSYSKTLSLKSNYDPKKIFFLIILIMVIGMKKMIKKEELVDTKPNELVDIPPRQPLEGDEE